MDECIILLILIIIVAALIVLASAYPSILGGATALTAIGYSGGSVSLKHRSSKSPKHITVNPLTTNKDDQLFISDHAKLVVDGHNMIHQMYANAHISVQKFEDGLKTISQMLSDSFKTQELHIVIKNPKESIAKMYNKLKKSQECEEGSSKPSIKCKLSKQSKQSKPRKKTSEERILYFRELVKLSKEYPRITYHLAYGKEPVKSNCHHLKGRDDFLTIYLSKNGYMISQDKFRDFKQFACIKSFKHYSVTDGVVHDKETIKPINQYTILEAPSIGNHLTYSFFDKKDLDRINIKPGQIFLNNNSSFGRIYFSKYT